MINLKQVIEKYRNLKSLNEILMENFKDFDEKIRDYAEEIGECVDDGEVEKGVESGDIEIEEEMEFIMSPSLETLMKKEYRAISKTCHPDVESSKILNRFFEKTSEAYQEKNVFEVLDISCTLFEKFSFLASSKDKDLMIKYLDEETLRVKNHRLWRWSYMTSEEKEKEYRKTLTSIFSKKK